MHTIGHQPLGFGPDTHGDLDDGEDQVDDHADPGAARGGLGAHSGGNVVVFAVVFGFFEIHEMGFWPQRLTDGYRCMVTLRAHGMLGL